METDPTLLGNFELVQNISGVGVGNHIMSRRREGPSFKKLGSTKWEECTSIPVPSFDPDGVPGKTFDADFKKIQLYHVSVISKTRGRPEHLLERIETLALQAALRPKPEYQTYAESSFPWFLDWIAVRRGGGVGLK